MEGGNRGRNEVQEGGGGFRGFKAKVTHRQFMEVY